MQGLCRPLAAKALPEWVKVEPCPKAHLTAMLAAARAMRGRAEAALDDLAKTPPSEGKADAASRLRGLAAEADSVTSFGESLWSPYATGEVHEKAENYSGVAHAELCSVVQSWAAFACSGAAMGTEP